MSAPKFLQKPQLKQEDGGKRLVFTCQIEGSPKPAIQWFRGDDPLKDGGRLQSSVKDDGANKYTIQLQITGVTADDGGTYKVVAKNDKGEGTASINLNFQGEQ